MEIVRRPLLVVVAAVPGGCRGGAVTGAVWMQRTLVLFRLTGPELWGPKIRPVHCYLEPQSPIHQADWTAILIYE